MTEFTREPPAMVQFVDELHEAVVVVVVVVVLVFSDSIFGSFFAFWVCDCKSLTLSMLYIYIFSGFVFFFFLIFHGG